MKTHLRYDAKNMPAGRELEALGPKLTKAKQEVTRSSTSGEQGWMTCADDVDMVRRVNAMAKKMARFSQMLVIGIGGSDLAARALYKALRKEGKPLYFAGSNTDPDELHELLQSIDLRKTAINIISKSGDTIEPMATFFIVRERLHARVGKKKAAGHIVATTDEDAGSLRELAKRDGYDTLPVPKNIGGRFSGLTDVGLFPLAFAGIDIAGLLDGARLQRDAFLKEPPRKNAPSRFAALQFLAGSRRRQRIQVLMPYAERLREFAFWYRQLWAESLGKRGKGPTPVAALGATDQHSQIQLYNDGPNDKTITFIEVEKFAHDLPVPASIREVGKLSYIAGTSLQRILHAERKATAHALAQSGKPHGTIVIPSLTPESMGELIMFFELATALSGELYGVNAYDQPGVEAGKRAMYDFLIS